MLDKIIRFSLGNRLFVLLAAVLLTVGGLYTMFHMDVDVFPDLNAPTVVVMTEAPGMASEEVERLVTFPVETAVNGAAGVRRVRSSSTAGFSVVWVEFDWGTDIYRDRQIVSEKLAEAGESLPTSCGKPVLGPQSSILGEVMIIGLTSDKTSMLDLRTLADWSIRPRLLALGGVAQVTVIGGDIKEYQILLSPEKMKYYGISLQQVLDAAEQMNANSNGGVMYEYGNEYIIRGLLSTSDTGEMGRTVVGFEGGSPILLSDISEIHIGAKSPKLGTASQNAKPAVLLTVTKQPESSTIELTGKIDAAMQDLQASLPEDVEVSTDIFRQERFIDSSIDNIRKSLFEGAIFVVIVLFLFLMNVRTTLISLVTIPLSLIVSILTLKAMGLTINTMSIGGMAIAIGSLVDDAIVDVENVFKHLRANRKLPPSERKGVIEVVFNASREVRLPILNSTFIIVVSFVPLFFLSGMEGRMLRPLGIAFITALFASTVVALTLTPVLCSYLLGADGSDRSGKDPLVVRKLRSVYFKALEWVLAHKKTVLGTVGVLFVTALAVFISFGSSFLPSFNEGSFTINVSTVPGISLEESDKIGRRAEELLLQIPEIQMVARKTGRAELDEHSLGVNVSEIEAPFELAGRSRDELFADVRSKLGSIPGANIEIGQPISHRIDAMLSGTRANIAIKIFGTDLDKLFSIGNQIKGELSGITELADVNVEQQVERPQLQIVPKRGMLSKYGITPREFSQFVDVLLAGEAVSSVYEGNRVFDLTIKAADNEKASITRLRDICIDTDSLPVPLSEVAEIRSASGPNTISRENVSRKIVVSANVVGGDLKGAVEKIRKTIDREIVLPKDYHIEYGGQFESAESASKTLLLTSFMAIIVIFLLLYGQFRDLKQASAVLLNLPLALIGGVFAIFFADRIVSIPAIIGFISLFGIATRNGMLLIDRYNELRKEGLSLHEAVLRGSLDRLNPILMTALTSALALVPLALGGDLPGNEIQSPMAKVLLGGLLTSTILNGFIIPIVYVLISRSKVAEREETV